MTNNISYYISNYFTIELDDIKEVSLNTRKTYRDATIQLLDYMQLKSKNINNLVIEDFSEEIINDFISYLRNEKKLNENSCNVKLAAIQGLFKYIRRKNIKYMELCNEIINIKYKKIKTSTVECLTIEEITKLFQIFNINNYIEYKHFMIVTTLYETAARVQELCDLKVEDINFNSNSITLHGKGNKTRVIPVNKILINNLYNYVNVYKLKKENYLFTNKNKGQLTRVGIQYIIDKYINIAKKKFPELYQINVSNHTFRHSKAMHMLESGVNIVYIRDILGHSSITTTEIYAKCSMELKKRELEKNLNSIQDQVTYTEKEKYDLINWLKEMI